MVISRPLAIFVAILLASYVIVLALVIPDAWNDYQDGFSTTFRNATDETLCANHPMCDPGGAVIKAHSTAHWDMDGSCHDRVRGNIYTNSGELIYSRTVKCGDWSGRWVVINKRGDEYIVTDDFDSPYEP